MKHRRHCSESSAVVLDAISTTDASCSITEDAAARVDDKDKLTATARQLDSVNVGSPSARSDVTVEGLHSLPDAKDHTDGGTEGSAEPQHRKVADRPPIRSAAAASSDAAMHQPNGVGNTFSDSSPQHSAVAAVGNNKFAPEGNRTHSAGSDLASASEHLSAGERAALAAMNDEPSSPHPRSNGRLQLTSVNLNSPTCQEVSALSARTGLDAPTGGLSAASSHNPASADAGLNGTPCHAEANTRLTFSAASFH